MDRESIESARYDADQLREELVHALYDGGVFSAREKRAIRSKYHHEPDDFERVIENQIDALLKYPPENEAEVKDAVRDAFEEVFGERE